MTKCFIVIGHTMYVGHFPWNRHDKTPHMRNALLRFQQHICYFSLESSLENTLYEVYSDSRDLERKINNQILLLA